MAKVRLWKKITPAQLNVAGMKSALADAMWEVAEEVVKDFKKTTDSWEHQPHFDSLIELEGGIKGHRFKMEVSTDDQQYRWVNDGTRPHWEEPVNAKALAFTYQSSPKTMPGVIDSEQFTPGRLDLISMGMVHPGAEPRHFDKEIANKWRKIYRQKLNAQMRPVVVASGHSMEQGSPSRSKVTQGKKTSKRTSLQPTRNTKSFGQRIREVATKAAILGGLSGFGV